MHDTFGGDQRVGHFLNGGRFAFEDQDFEAVVMIKVHMEGRQDEIEMIVLHGGEPLRQETHVMIVNQSQRSDDQAVRFGGGLLNEGFTDEVAEGFGAIGVAALGDVVVEGGEEVGIDGYADAAEIAHLF